MDLPPLDDDYYYEGYDGNQESYSFNRTELDTAGRPRTSRYPATRDRPFNPMTARLRTTLPAGRLGTAVWRPTTTRPGTGRPRPTTTKNDDTSEGMNRPLTAIQAAGYIDRHKLRPVDLLTQDKEDMTDLEPANVKFERKDSPMRRLEKQESKIWQLLDESAMAGCAGKKKEALELAKEAQHQETVLIMDEDEIGDIGHDYDISLSIILNLAIQHEACEMYKEALGNYETLFSLTYPTRGFHKLKFRLNMGNIYMKLKQPNKALKVYRMALDQVRHDNTWLRMKLMHNTGLVYLQVGKLDDAVTYFENVMRERPTFKVGFHLLVANFMANDAFSAKRNFQELLEISLNSEEKKQEKANDDPEIQLLADLFKNDPLSKYQDEKRTYAERCIITSGRLIAPIIEDTVLNGYDWVVEAVRNSKYASLVPPLNISKAVALIKKGDVKQATEIFLAFENETTKYLPVAATNLSFIYYLRGEIDAALKYGNMAIDQDVYNGAAYVNVGNCIATSGNIQRASVIYNSGIEHDSSLVEAKYNLGLVNLEMREFDQAEFYFNKVLELTPNNADALFQMGRTEEEKGNQQEAVNWYLKVLAVHPHDAGVFKAIARNLDEMGDKPQAHAYYADCFKYNPSDVEVIKWLTVYLTKKNLPDEAVKYYERGMLLQPNDPVWRLSIAKCHKHAGNSDGAIEAYKTVLQKFPDNLEAVDQLIQLTKDAGDKEASKSYTELRLKLEPKVEIEYDLSRIVCTPRPKAFRRILPEDMLKPEPKDPFRRFRDNKSRQAPELPFLVKKQVEPEAPPFPIPQTHRDQESAENTGPMLFQRRRAMIPDTPREEEDDPNTAYRKAIEERHRDEKNAQYTPRRPRSGRASTAKIRMARDGLFDDITPPNF